MCMRAFMKGIRRVKKSTDRKIPKYSDKNGTTDSGISEVLGKSPGFRYSDKFKEWWYGDE